MPETPDHTSWLTHFEDFEKTLNGQATSPIHSLRKHAIAAFERLGYPTSQDEAWKTVNLAPLRRAEFRPAPDADNRTLTQECVQLATFPNLDALRMVFVNGAFRQDLSDLTHCPQGVEIRSLATAIASQPDLIAQHLAKQATYEELAFTALNTAFIQDGAWVHVSKGVILESPIHLIFISSPHQEPTVSHPRSLIVVDENAQATLIETYIGPEDIAYFTNAVTEIFVGPHALVDHYKLEQEGRSAVHISNHQSVLGQNSVITSHAFTLGGRFVRNDVHSRLAGESSESTINGLYVLGNDQHVDNYTLLEHAEPNSPSHELYKGVLGGNARAIFRGKIYVHRIAQKTDAYQSNQNLLLSNNARVNTKPQLEIYADDVKCSHGATVGQLDEAALFYLRSRGISSDRAYRILIQAFTGEVLDQVRSEPVRECLSQLMDRKLEEIQSL
ncbi:MAG: Fe-S cluster assembly protein SufD [bacterium]|nr:Fe-S cluster assembly protein SufD [bacterium]